MENLQENTQANNELNGLDLTKGHETINAIKNNGDLATFKFRSRNEWLNGFHNRTTLKPFYGAGQEYEGGERFVLEADAPLILLGTDQAADPVEYVLHALTACMTSTLVFHCATKGIRITKLNSSMEGDIDLHGFLALKDVRKGFSEIRATFNIETDAREEDLTSFLKYSPVYEMISAGVPVKVSFHINKPVLS